MLAYPWTVERCSPSLQHSVSHSMMWHKCGSHGRAVVYRATVQNYSHFPEYEEAYRRWHRDPSDSWRFIDEGDEPQRWLRPVIGPWEHRRPFRFVTHNSRQLRFRTLFARFTVADQITQCKENYNYEHKLFQLRLLASGDYSAGCVYTPDLGTMLPQQRANFTGRREFIVILRTQLRTGLTPAFHCDFQCIRISHNDKRMGRYSITDKLASSLLYSLFSRLINTVTITGNVSSIMIALKILKLCLINVPMTHMLRCRLSNHI
jgi:hypothetical protein